MSPILARVFLPIICALLAVCCSPGLRAEEYTQRVWETDDGLPHNGVNGLVQRRDGFLWMATQNGLVRFDGLEFRKWRSPLLADAQTSAIRAIIEEDANTLLVANDPSGLLRLRGGEVSLHPLAERIRRRTKISLLFQEGEGVFWIIFANREVWRCQGAEAQVFPAPVPVDVYLPVSVARTSDGTVYLARGNGVERYAGQTLAEVTELPHRPAAVCAAEDGALWVATPEKLCRLEGGMVSVVLEPVPWTPDSSPHVMMEDSRGALWIGTRGQGLWRWADGHAEAMPASYSRINDLLEDDTGNIWVATAGGGVNRLQRARFGLIGEERGVLPNIMGTVCEDATGELWFANRNCGGRVRNGGLEAPTFAPEFLRKMGPVCADGAGNVWLVAGTRLCRWKAGGTEAPQWMEMEPLGNIHALYAARDGSLWVLGENGPLVRFRAGERQQYGAAEGYDSQMAQAMGENAAGELWVGTERGALFQMKNGRWVRHDAKEGLPNSGVRAIYGDAQGTMWIGFGGGGLVVRYRGKFSIITEANGLPDDTLSQIVEDDYGVLWFGASRGLFKLRKSDVIDFLEGRAARVNPILFDKSDGLTGFSATANYQPSAWKTRSGRLWFATRKGLVTTMPEPQSPDAREPRVYLDAVVADGHPLSLQGPAAMASSVKKLEFEYTTPIYTSPEKARFRHRLEGFEQEWVEGGAQRSVSYGHLPPGRYVFRVTAGNRDLVWNPTGISFAFEVLPAWWETTGARVLGLALCAAALVALVRHWSHRRLRERLAAHENRRRLELERARIARDLHDSLGASLTQAGMLAEELSEDCQDLEEMKECSAELANRVRVIARDLDAAVWAVSPKNDSLASLCAYLCQFAIEYFRDTPTRCRVHMDDDIPALPLTPEVRHHLFLTAREACNNVLKHAQAREVQITLRSEGREFVLAVEDDGRGFVLAEAEAGERHGLRNMRARIGEMGGGIDIQSKPGHTVVRISMTLTTALPNGAKPEAIP